MIQIHTIRQPRSIHIRSIPFELCNVTHDMQGSQLILRDLPDDLTGNGEYLDLDILRHIAARYRKDKGRGGRERVWIVQHIGDHGLGNDLKAYSVWRQSRRIVRLILPADNKL